MMQAYQFLLDKHILATSASLENAVWVDVFCPNAQEEAAIETAFKIALPTREEMREIEPSSRLYSENGNLYLTASLLCNALKETPKLAVVTFILTPKHFITLRYDTPKSFELFLARVGKEKSFESYSPAFILASLLDTITDRAADILEQTSEEVDKASALIFSKSNLPKNSFQRALLTVGHKGDVVAKARESLFSLSRLLLYFAAENEALSLDKATRSQIKTQQMDVDYLKAHCDALENKISFLMNATMGLVSLQQNSIIKIFSVVSVIFMPPTMIASIYGMNFKTIPELQWDYGYYYALILMGFSAVLPYVLFKWKKWL
jgi:magnesium transporter